MAMQDDQVQDAKLREEITFLTDLIRKPSLAKVVTQDDQVQDAKLREEIKFLTDLISKHKTVHAAVGPQPSSQDCRSKPPCPSGSMAALRTDRSSTTTRDAKRSKKEINKLPKHSQTFKPPWPKRATSSGSQYTWVAKSVTELGSSQDKSIEQSIVTSRVAPFHSVQCSSRLSLCAQVNRDGETGSTSSSHGKFTKGTSSQECKSPARSSKHCIPFQDKYKIVKTKGASSQECKSPALSSKHCVPFQDKYKIVKTRRTSAIVGASKSSSNQRITPIRCTQRSVRSSSSISQAQEGVKSTSSPKSRVLTRYKLVKYVPHASVSQYQIDSSNRLLKRAVKHAYKHKRNNSLQDPCIRRKLSAGMWVGQYSLKRNHSEKAPSPGVSMLPGKNRYKFVKSSAQKKLTGKSVTNISKDRYKFVKSSGQRKLPGRSITDCSKDRYKFYKSSAQKKATSRYNVTDVSKNKYKFFKSSAQKKATSRYKVDNTSAGQNKRYRRNGPLVLNRSKLKLDRRKPFNQPGRHDTKRSSHGWGGMTRFQHLGSFTVNNSNTRIRASYALKRSLYTAAKSRKHKQPERQYCLFYNRFGRCKRGDKCHNIHDPDRVAVCTRFLRGTCKITDCPFSHTVSKEKMPVCSFFLRGVCIRDNCPYLHVNVSRDAELCQEFAKGYCAMGDKCKHKHLLVCPDFKRDRRCPRGKGCFLKHPKKGAERKGTETGNRAVSAGEEATARLAKTLKRSKSTQDLDNINLPMKDRILPSYIALESSPAGILSASASNLRHLPITVPHGGQSKKAIFPSFLPQGK